MTFAGNKARVGPVMFVSNLAACEWYSLDPKNYFEPDNMERWRGILDIKLVAFIECLEHITTHYSIYHKTYQLCNYTYVFSALYVKLYDQN